VGDKEQYQQELHAQLDAWTKDLAKLKSISAKASADARAAMQQHIVALESRVEDGRKKLSELAGASDETWATVREGVETAWSALKKAFGDAAHKIKD